MSSSDWVMGNVLGACQTENTGLEGFTIGEVRWAKTAQIWYSGGKKCAVGEVVTVFAREPEGRRFESAWTCIRSFCMPS